MKRNLSALIATKTIQDQGYSVNLEGHEPVKGYMVGLKGSELKINVLDFNSEHVDHFIRKNLGVLYYRRAYIGTWIDNDLVYIDISTNIMYKDQALKAAKIEGQQCIWDIKEKKEIYQLEEGK
jgi:hypothetical protein